MIPIYIKNFVDNQLEMFNHLLDLPWLEATEARKEYFMSASPISYTYGIARGARTYHSVDFTSQVQNLMNFINDKLNCHYDVCFLNRYDNKNQALSWHADDSPEMNANHDICVVSFGAEREIWWKLQDHKGEIPKENRQLLQNGSLFVMPAGFQQKYFHKIPRCDRSCSTRISLTFRNYVSN